MNFREAGLLFKSLQKPSSPKPHQDVGFESSKWHSNRHAPRNTKERKMRSKIRWFTVDLQFTLHIAFRCVLHRCESQEIRCWKLFFITFMYFNILNILVVKKNDIDLSKGKPTSFFEGTAVPTRNEFHPPTFQRSTKYVHSWRNDKDDKRAHVPKDQQQPVQVYSIMILPQVHLRKPCYDFYFL